MKIRDWHVGKVYIPAQVYLSFILSFLSVLYLCFAVYKAFVIPPCCSKDFRTIFCALLFTLVFFFLIIIILLLLVYHEELLGIFLYFILVGNHIKTLSMSMIMVQDLNFSCSSNTLFKNCRKD